MSIAIVGAGITGLATAWLLLKQGVPVTIYEASPHEGGLAGSYRTEGFAFDFGPHEFSTDNPVLKEHLREICGDDLLVIDKKTAQFFNGRFVRYPFEIVDVIKNVNPLLTTRAILEVAYSRIRNLVKPPKDDSFEAWTYSRFGRTLYDLYFGPYTQKVWGMDPGLLDPRTASQRITVDSVWDLIKKTLSYQFLGAEDFKRTHSEFRRQFFYVRHGIGTLQNHLRARIEDLGGRFHFGKALAGLTIEGGRIEKLDFTDGSTAEGLSHVISTIPLPLLVEMVLADRAREVLVQHVLPFRSMAFVFVRVAKPKVSDYHWIYYPDLDIPFQRLTEFVHFNAQMSPPGTTGLTLEVSCSPGDGVWELGDREIANRCITRLEELKLLEKGDVLGADVVRTRHAYPLQVTNFLEKSEALLDSISHVRNLVSIGRQGLFRYCNMNECMEMAIDVVPKLLAGESSIRYTRDGTWLGVGLTDRYTVSGPNS